MCKELNYSVSEIYVGCFCNGGKIAYLFIQNIAYKFLFGFSGFFGFDQTSTKSVQETGTFVLLRLDLKPEYKEYPQKTF